MSGAGWVFPHTGAENLPRPSWKPEGGPLQISPADAVAEASTKYCKDAFGKALSHAPRWVTQDRRRRWQRGSLCFLTSARLRDRAW